MVTDALTATLAELADPAPAAPAPDWTAALCAQSDPEAWFAERGAGYSDTIRYAKKICNRCSLVADCLEWAVATDQRFGVWGGLSETERRQLRKGVAA